MTHWPFTPMYAWMVPFRMRLFTAATLTFSAAASSRTERLVLVQGRPPFQMDPQHGHTLYSPWSTRLWG